MQMKLFSLVAHYFQTFITQSQKYHPQYHDTIHLGWLFAIEQKHLSDMHF
jgi:hypothetical protein